MGPPDGELKNTRGCRILIAEMAIIILLAAKIVASFLPAGRLWGINQLAYYPAWLAIIFLGVIISLIIVLSNNNVSHNIGRYAHRLARVGKSLPRPLIFLVAAILFSALFYLLKDRTNLLGDGLLRIGELQNRRLEDIFEAHSAEPLDYLLHYIFYSYFLITFKIKPIVSYQILSCLAGLFYILAAYLFARRVKSENLSFSAAFAYLLGWGGIMLFFGYVESYALAAAAMLFLFNYALKYFQGSGKDYWVIGLFLLCFFLHNTALIFLPSLVYLLFRGTWSQKTRPIIMTAIILFVVGIWVGVAYGSKEGSILLMPASSSEPNYLLLGKAHLADILNELLLISPACVVLIWLQSIKSELWRRRYRIFCWLAMIGGLAFVLMVDPVLGMARDWDLFALALLGLHVALLVGVNWKESNQFIQKAILIIPVSLVFFGVLLGSNEASSIARYKNIAALDDARSRYAYERLGTYLLLRQRWQEAEDVYNLSLKKESHFRTYVGLAYVQYQEGKFKEAQQNFEKTLELKPDQVLALYSLCNIYAGQGRFKEARDLLERLKKAPRGGIVAVNDRAIAELEEKLNQQMLNQGFPSDSSDIRQ